MAQYVHQGRGRTQEKSLSRGLRNFKKHLKDPVRESEEIGQGHIHSSGKQIHCAPAEWKDMVSSKSNPSRVADEHNDALKTQIITQVQRHKVHPAHAKAAGQSIEGMDNSVEEQTVIPGYIKQCM